MKICTYCGDEFQEVNKTQHVCQSNKCRIDHKRKIAREYTYRNGISSPDGKNFWTEEDVQFLKENRFMDTKEMSDYLGRSIASVKEKRSRLKLPMLVLCLSCGCTCNRTNQHELCDECTPTTSEYAVKYRLSIKGKWQTYKSNAKRRGLPFNLSLLEFSELWNKDCVYCGSEISTIGIDRISSSLGYVVGNIVPCCSRCNEMKMAQSVGSWVEEMKTILTHMGEI